MPPTFPIILGFIAYLGLLGLSTIVGAPMLLFKKYRLQGKTIILTTIISFPTLLIVGLTMTLLLALPGLGAIYILKHFDLLYVVGILFLIFIIIVAISALYHWYIGYILIKNLLNKRPIDFKIENDKIYSIFLKKIVQYYGVTQQRKTPKAKVNNLNT